ncbi:MAG: hypothetical protein AVDCRST_MAG68-2975, partial [uncultured Gemmatimonadetes bacterium]
ARCQSHHSTPPDRTPLGLQAAHGRRAHPAAKRTDSRSAARAPCRHLPTAL